MSERKLAHVEKIINIEPIDGADKIEVATVLGWKCVIAKKDNYKIGDLVVYIEVDSRVPDISIFEFLRDRNFKVKTIKLRKQISQGLIVPILTLPKGKYVEGTDVTKELGITKILSETEEKDKLVYKSSKNSIVIYFMRFKWFRKLREKLIKPEKMKYPTYLSKTDEERIQNIPQMLTQYKDKLFYVTEKIDGQSLTLYKHGNKYGVGSRNWILLKEDNSSWWTIANNIKYKEVLNSIFKYYSSAKTIILQGEILGPNIQSNKYKLTNFDFYAFNIIVDNVQLSYDEMKLILDKVNVESVICLDDNFILPETVDELVEYSKGKSKLMSTIEREGIVIRLKEDAKVSFKVINPNFLLRFDF